MDFCKCATCKRIVPLKKLVEVPGEFGPVRVCRDVMACDYAARPWKAPGLTDKERNALRVAHGLLPLAKLAESLGFPRDPQEE
jgi:hypothetical protein